MNKILKIPVLTTVFLSFLAVSGCGAKKVSVEPYTKTDFILGTVCSVTLYDKPDDKAINAVFNRLKEIEKKMTINNAETSEIINLNNNAGKSAVKVSPDTFYVLQKGLEYGKASGGKFDITIGALTKLWNIGFDNEAVPKDQDIKSRIPLVDYKELVLDKNNYTAKLQKPGMMVDLGGIAKGYAADEATDILVNKYGVKHAIVNLGGNVKTIGENPNGNLWKIGIQDPNDQTGKYLGVIEIKDKTVVSSGTYERFFIQNGKKYHHILDVKTGYPVENNLLQTTIIMKSSIDADSLSTSTFAEGLEKGLKLIEGMKDVEAIFVTSDKKVYVTSGIKDNFTVTNKNYTLVKD